jgi:putative tryptophan/tyrosine transport system substrate-binding protein
MRRVLVRRRDFVRVLGGAALAWPRGVLAQKSVKQIGILLPGSETDPELQTRLDALRKGLRELGWVEGQNYRFEYRWPGFDPERTSLYAAQLVGLAPDVIVTGGALAVQVLRRESRSIPILFVNVADPVGGGLISSLQSSGGNVTGFASFEYSTAGKWLELLKEIAPRVARVAVVLGAAELGPTGEGFYRALEAVAPQFSVGLTAIRVLSSADVEPAIDLFAAKSDCGLIAAADAVAANNRALIIRSVARHRMPAVYPFRYYAAAGGMVAYGPDILDEYRRAASYVDRILKGANPADLPVQLPDKFALIINLGTAKALDIAIPPSLLRRADEIIE